jgi:phosphatidate cytidylyltransferase
MVGKLLSPRVATALIGIPLVALIVHFGGPVFNVVVVLLALLSLRELEAAARTKSTPFVAAVAYPVLLFMLLAGWKLSVAADIDLVSPPLVWVVPFALLIWAVLSYGTRQRVSLASVALTQLAIFYVGLFMFLILLRARSLDGSTLVWLTLLGVWAGDIVAYYAGRALGRRKLTPLSPGKTVEGVVAGFAATIAVCLIVAHLSRIGWQHGLAMGVLIGIAAPIGDLAESFWKRELGVKDLGTLLPGHGGVLDRCDSLLFAVFVVYCYALSQM